MGIYKKSDSRSVVEFDNTDQFKLWYSEKIKNYPRKINDITVTVESPLSLSGNEVDSIQAICQKTNLAVVRFTEQPDKAGLKQFGHQLGLNVLDNNLCADEEAISSIEVREGGSRQEGYIPYTQKALNWHTDGYYNLETQQINAILMYCVEKPESGGANKFLDHEILYGQLREINPDYIKVLTLANVMTIPPNIVDGVEIRTEQTGPVFSVNSKTGRLHMRYSARKRNIVWLDEPLVHEAASAIEKLLSHNEYIFNYTPQPGQVVVSNNCLHSRDSFTDNAAKGLKRKIYRARYLDRLTNT